MRQYSLSDRSRYYWHVPAVAQAVETLLEDLKSKPIPLSLLAEYLPLHFRSIKPAELTGMEPRELVLWAVEHALSPYRDALRNAHLGPIETRTPQRGPDCGRL